jgi:hypothetical protein
MAIRQLIPRLRNASRARTGQKLTDVYKWTATILEVASSLKFLSRMRTSCALGINEDSDVRTRLTK